MELMKRELLDALQSAAAGLTTSRSDWHATSGRRPVASLLVTWDEVVSLVHLMRLSLDCGPEWREIRDRPLQNQRRLLSHPEVRNRLVNAAHHGD